MNPKNPPGQAGVGEEGSAPRVRAAICCVKSDRIRLVRWIPSGNLRSDRTGIVNLLVSLDCQVRIGVPRGLRAWNRDTRRTRCSRRRATPGPWRLPPGRKRDGRGCLAVSFLVASAAFPALAQDKVFVGHLADYTGATSYVGKYYGPGVRDAVDYINAVGGVAGRPIDMETVDYAYKIPEPSPTTSGGKAKAWSRCRGWGTGITEGSSVSSPRTRYRYGRPPYSGHLTDPTGKNPDTKKPAPYNFFYGPSYTDACRAMVQWAAGDTKAKGLAQAEIHSHRRQPSLSERP